ncbi:MAG: glutamate synthase subunit beta [Deltaproteobacteria bacterium]|jgi:glutamate synthase (NADPH/NADH) small chain|nr:glutamate synthase subunit beta [Deltaproteobacteria bacterium]
MENFCEQAESVIKKKPSLTAFLVNPRRELEKRSAAIRKSDLLEFTTVFSDEVLKEQGSRCMDCGVPFCQSDTGCPLHNYIPEWNTLAAEGDWKSALERLHATNNFPEFTGKLCPAPCESACVLGVIAEPVSIKAIEESIIDRGFANGWIKPIKATKPTGRKIAIVGSGPAGLTAAQELVRAGHTVTVFEKAQKIGGLLRYGIPDFKFEKSLLDRRLQQLEEEGVEFRTGISVGQDISFSDLRAENDAVCLAIGAERPRDLEVPGRELKGIHFAMDFLIQQNQSVSGEGPRQPKISASGKRVIILGGGDTGSDCLGTALRQGAKSVLQFEILQKPPLMRAKETPWPTWPMKLRTSHAHEEGGLREWGFMTTMFTGDGDSVQRLHGKSMELETELQFDADLVLLAMGFSGPMANPLLNSCGAKVDARGKILVDEFNMTSIDGVFAAGDVNRGASLIVWAIAEGRKTATSISSYLESAQRVKSFNGIREVQR